MWLLEYKGEGHVLFDRSVGWILALNGKSFFDYYLKDKAAPTWRRKRLE